MFVAETTYAPPGDENFIASRSSSMLSHETTYAPPGDENAVAVASLVSVPRNNLHPARGRKRVAVAVFAEQQPETTYTPSGDENTCTL